MGRAADIRTVAEVSAQTFWETVYEKPEATERYHLSYNKSSAPRCSAWSAGQRTVSFHMPLQMPDFVKRMVGLDTVHVNEVQRVVWTGSGAFSVSSETIVTNMLGASRFTTSLQLSASESASGSGPLELVYSVRCAAASVPWPMSATIENLMTEKALGSMQFFLDFTSQLLEEQQQLLQLRREEEEAQQQRAAEALGGEAGEGVAAAAEAVLDLELDGGAKGAAAGAPGGAEGASAAHHPAALPAAPSFKGGSMRRRWPSITTTHDIISMSSGGSAHMLAAPSFGGGAMADAAAAAMAGGGGAHHGPVLQRQPSGGPSSPTEQAHGHRLLSVAEDGGPEVRPASVSGEGPGDMFVDAREAFGGMSGSVSGYNSDGGGLSPQHLARLQHDGGWGAVAGAVAHEPALVQPLLGRQDAGAVAAALERLVAAVAALDRKLDASLAAQGRPAGELAAGSEQGGAGIGSRARKRGVPLGAGGEGEEGQDSAGARRCCRFSTRGLLRLVAVLLLANLLVVGFWLLHPHATGLKPHGGGGGATGGAGAMLLGGRGEGALGAAAVPLRRMLRS